MKAYKLGAKPKVKYRTIRVREEVAVLLDEWRDIFDDASISEVLYRVFALARRELRRVKEKKEAVRAEIVKERNEVESLADLAENLW